MEPGPGLALMSAAQPLRPAAEHGCPSWAGSGEEYRVSRLSVEDMGFRVGSGGLGQRV